MKIYISADMEGITGTTHWDEVDKKSSDFEEFQKQMTAEVAAACEGALKAGAKEIWVKDAHADARNIIPSKLPQEVRLIRGWSDHPFSMVQDLDETFHAVLMIGYHSPAGSGDNPLAHTMTGDVTQIKINEVYASEFLLHTYAAALKNVPVVFVSGDEGLCEEAKSLIPSISTVAVKHGKGDSTINIHPQLAVEKIREGVQRALEGDVCKCNVRMPEHFSIEIKYKEHMKAYQSSFYPGTSLKDPHTIHFESDDYFEILRLILFVI
jgi:D-amino peptidase